MDEVIVLHKLLGDGSLTSSGGSHDNAVQVPPHSPTKVPHTYSSRRNHPVLTGATSSQNNYYFIRALHNYLSLIFYASNVISAFSYVKLF